MLQRYLGNKAVLVRPILKIVRELASSNDLICDAFSGSLAVSISLKNAGYRVASNDINLLSWVYGVAYLLNNSLPKPPLNEFTSRYLARRTPGFATRVESARDQGFAAWVGLLEYLYSPYDDAVPPSERRTDFFDHYCEAGGKSAFVSSRGRTGRRRFFTAENASLIDRALSRIRWWWRTDQIDEVQRCMMTCCLLDAIEKVSNTQGTYHDFPRGFYDPRALKRIGIEPPNLDALEGPPTNILGKALDSLEFVRTVPDHSVLYLDPPYNFRQYTAYYFLPNLVAAYPEIDDLDKYFANVAYVRGQNKTDDFTSTFCSAKRFIPSMETIIRRARCRYVLISYFDGKNHWGNFKSHPDNEGRVNFERFLVGELFVPGTMRCIPIDRLNYQSYGGYKARPVQEFLFVVEKKRTDDLIYPSGEVQERQFAGAGRH